MLIFIQFLFFSLLLDVSYASSICMANCNSLLTHHPPTLYEQYCCNTDNSGKTIKLSENNRVKIIICPNYLPMSCQRFVTSLNNCSKIFGMNASAVSGYYVFKGLFVYCDIVDYINGLNFSDCHEIFQKQSFAPSGYYKVQVPNGSLISVYCDMEGSNCDGKGGWTRVGYLNMSEPNASCPPGLIQQQHTNFRYNLCGRPNPSSGGCNSVFYSTFRFNFTNVCGQVRGYQFGSTDAFHSNYRTIDSPYVHGVSITYGNNARKHLWTYAAGVFENILASYDCPCNTGYSSQYYPPSFVGNSYYCESGNNQSSFEEKLYADDFLWDGENCNGLEAPCCTNNKMPWFYSALNSTTSDDIELRVCTDYGLPNEGTPLDIIELYIK